ncbi:FxLD family lanthipeptide [Microbispora sp. NBRC 16548]|uniref:FxLD family lanthipeptide n=1 Tax=Microbispora sp. NBRC 16548 TaxID=3030994 RepID=UPI0016163784|nr:FxLD family lanthipeptide [Microbispora sp. NBRC 16548]GLX06651.1 hypothetical protein Misp03_35780 [Microbispora sp. NBRC 16548]
MSINRLGSIQGHPTGAPTQSYSNGAPTQGPASRSPFTLDVRVVEAADPAGLVNVTDDGCGSTCGACVTGAA